MVKCDECLNKFYMSGQNSSANVLYVLYSSSTDYNTELPLGPPNGPCTILQAVR